MDADLNILRRRGTSGKCRITRAGMQSDPYSHFDAPHPGLGHTVKCSSSLRKSTHPLRQQGIIS
jgi:hypothetical protein